MYALISESKKWLATLRQCPLITRLNLSWYFSEKSILHEYFGKFKRPFKKNFSRFSNQQTFNYLASKNIKTTFFKDKSIITFHLPKARISPNLILKSPYYAQQQRHWAHFRSSLLMKILNEDQNLLVFSKLKI